MSYWIISNMKSYITYPIYIYNIPCGIKGSGED